MTYRIDQSGQAVASLDLDVAAPIARAFGRRAVKGVEAAGGALAGAEIVGTDAEPAIEAAAENAMDASTDRADLEKELARSDLTPAVRSDLIARRAELSRAKRRSSTAADAARASVSTTPMSFTYEAGSGVGLMARLSEAAHDGYVSLTWTIATALTLLAYLGPPLILLFLVLLLWHRYGRRWWSRTFKADYDE